MPILPSGPMCSLRRAIMMWLVPLFVLVGVASVVFSYWSFSRMVDEFMDDQMRQLGESVSQQAQPVLPAVPPLETVHEKGVYLLQVFRPDGSMVVSSMGSIPSAPGLATGYHNVEVGGHEWRVYSVEPAAVTGHRVHVLQSMKFRAQLAASRAGASVAPLLIVLPLALLVLWLVAAKLSREVEAIGRRAALQDETSIAELPLSSVPSEIAPLVVSFNSLLARLRNAFAQQQRFVQDAAHELRTPITAVALQLENVRRDLPAGACQNTFAQLEAGVGRAQRLVDQMLRMSRQQHAAREKPVEIDLAAQLRESVGALIGLAERRRIDLGLVADDDLPEVLRLRCVATDLRSVLDNLIENALRYTPEGGVVDVRVMTEAGHPVIEVVDTGPGIAPDQIGRVFDRFYRVPGNEAQGSGLGLAIARSAAGRCGLELSLRNREDRSGLVARIALRTETAPVAPGRKDRGRAASKVADAPGARPGRELTTS